MANLSDSAKQRLAMALGGWAEGRQLIDILDAIDIISGDEAAVIDGVTPGTAAASKALVLDANKDIATIRHLTLSGNLVSGSTTLSEAELAFLDAITAGTPAASKALVLDANEELASLGRIRVTDTLISSVQVLALNASPITVVAAPGSGVYTEFLGAYVFLDWETAAYVDAAGDDLVFRYTDGSGSQVSIQADGSLFDGTADALVWVPAIGAAGAIGAVEMVDNAVIVLHLLNSEWTTGDSPLKVRVFHRQVRKASLEAIA